MISAGKLQHYVEIYAPSTTRDSVGAPSTSYVLQATAWADIIPISGRERLSAAQMVGDCDSRIILRWSPDVSSINASWQLRHGGVQYDVQWVNHLRVGMERVELLVRSRPVYDDVVETAVDRALVLGSSALVLGDRALILG